MISGARDLLKTIGTTFLDCVWPAHVLPKRGGPRRHPDKRMALGIADMPRYPGKQAYLAGETRDHYPDGTSKPRWQRDGGQA